MQIATLLRFALVPLWVLCAHANGVFGNDLFVAVLMAVFALTNGYNASLGMMYGPRKVGAWVWAASWERGRAHLVKVLAAFVAY